MNSLQRDLETVKSGLATMLNFTLNTPSKGLSLQAHREASDKWTKEEGPKVVDAALRVVGSLFTSLDRIANVLEEKNS
jgi:hypothetical protein